MVAEGVLVTVSVRTGSKRGDRYPCMYGDGKSETRDQVE
jgi:hypothetical protein